MSTNQTCGLASTCAGLRLQNSYTFIPACYKKGLPVTCAKDYSYLKATIGSMRIARRAGM